VRGESGLPASAVRLELGVLLGDYRGAIVLDSQQLALARLWGPCKVVGKPRVCAAERGTLRLVLIILGVILLVAAVAGGIAVHALLWLLAILGLVAFAIGALTGRITE
jgi:NAD/NADP transhydrogenase beta subunit